ncbi:MAG: ATP phosphoribosyltransferase [Armatimonadota bacterium]|nr:ATP phosphoribosyltransferase [Armatimonadota bacterium]
MIVEQNILRIGVPKGSLQEATFGLFRKAGYSLSVNGRSYAVDMDDPEMEGLLIRPQEIPRYVADGIIDCGLTGYDWLLSSGADLVEIAELVYAKVGFSPVRIVCAVAQDDPLKEVRELEGKRIATEYVELTQRWLAEHQVKAHVEFSWGACEMKVPALADAVIVNTETGSSIRANGLRIAFELMQSTTRFVANKEAWAHPWKRKKAEDLAMLLRGAINAQDLVGLKMNVRRADIPAVVAVLPALRKPTISTLSDEEWVAMETILDHRKARELVPELKRAGAEGIAAYPLTMVVY